VPSLAPNDNVEILNAGFMFREGGPDVREAPPVHGQHTEEVLRWLDFDAAQRREIMNKGE
jgi:crotonobetainyl-CoA:carnitine CoA-transferase CaiB-like acyl-CoA transferase